MTTLKSQYPFNLPITCIECGTRLLEDERAVIQPRRLDVTGPIYAIVIHERCDRGAVRGEPL